MREEGKHKHHKTDIHRHTYSQTDTVWITPSIHYHPSTGSEEENLRVGSSSGLTHDRWWSLDYAMRVRFTSKGGAKGNSDGQLVCNTLHGVMRQLGECIQLFPGVRRCGDTFFWAADQHDVTAYIQCALDSTCWHRGGHWQMERVGDDMLTTLQNKCNTFILSLRSILIAYKLKNKLSV